MDVFAKSIEAKDDLRTFVWDFGQEHNQVCNISAKYMQFYWNFIAIITVF